ncbi:hypothetical protein VNO77_05915 [Canavalia gladiata]|uniref:Uncharacterized protein n=1 Tax=Canavalia gladiata TaxID=3824 RepID=A0AAN9MZ76_CANGL
MGTECLVSELLSAVLWFRFLFYHFLERFSFLEVCFDSDVFNFGPREPSQSECTPGLSLVSLMVTSFTVKFQFELKTTIRRAGLRSRNPRVRSHSIDSI